MFGDILRHHRRRLGLSQQDLADRSGVTVRGLRKIESGQIATPRPVTVRLLADAFGLVGADRDQFCETAHRTPDVPPPPAWTGPAQLPADVAGFVGRTGALGQLAALLDSAGTQLPAGVISAVSGTAGVGKTALAVHWAHRVRHRFPDGQLYLNLRGFDPSGTVMTAPEAVRRFLDALAVPPQRIPADPDAQADLYRTLLADKTMLVVLDNARDADQVRPLLPGARGCFVLVTSRNRLTSLVAAEGAHPLVLDLLTPDEARDLLACRIGRARVTAEPAAVDELIAGCSRLPLALAIVTANATFDPHLSLASLAGQLRDNRGRLDVLATGDTAATDVRAVLSWSYEALTDASARLFRLLGLHPGPDVSIAAAASLAALPIDQVRPLLNELAAAHLVTQHATGRYTLHDLLRTYAAGLAHAVDTEHVRREATRRTLDHYLNTAYAGDRRLDTTRDAISLAPPEPGTIPEGLAGHEQALDWFIAEHEVLLAAVDLASATGFDTHTWQLAWTLYEFLHLRGHWHDQANIQRAAVAAARRLADPTAEARAHRSLAHAYTWLGDHHDARTELQLALDLTVRAGDQIGQAHTHHILSHLYGRQGQHVKALDHARQALVLYQSTGHRPGQALALNAIGWHHTLLGNHQQCLDYCQQALALHRKLGNRSGQADTCDSLGRAHDHLGQHADAHVCYQHAIDLFRELGNRYGQAQALTHLGDAHRSARNTHAARETWQQALSILDELGHPNADPVRDKLRDLGPR
ncbi:MAG TPA: tetratricopeptide repeat protein [Jiangellaceae bacterium]|nr:tetratricopeptide repeat protein [Jiangellaceae bacterium]